MAWLVANIVLTIFDDFGAADLANLIGVTVILVLLLAGRSGYFGNSREAGENLGESAPEGDRPG